MSHNGWFTEHDVSKQSTIRNFSIIAHIDHGKSTLADRFLEVTGALQAREMEAQVLDSMDLERERGITIKAHPVRLNYKADDGQTYVLNLIDTPGHVDFGYEVTRSLAACEGALLLVDASQGVEAQTLANAYLAVEQQPRDHPGHQQDRPARARSPTRLAGRSRRSSGSTAHTAILASAKEGRGVKEILEAIVARLPPPKGDPAAPLKALIFDSWYDAYRGVVIVVRVLDGTHQHRQQGPLMNTAQDHEVEQLGVFTPKPVEVDALGPGEVGFVACGIKGVADAQIGDTVTETARPTPSAVPGFKELKPMVFAGLYPVESHQYSRAARGAREAAAQRLGVLLRAGDLGRARLRVPLRLPRPAAHGDRPGAARARVRHGPGHDGAGRALPRDHHRRRRCRDRQPGQAAGGRQHRQDRGAGDHRDRS